MSVKQGGKTIAGATQYHPDLFDFKWADHILNDAQWLMADTFSWQYGSMYQAAYPHLAADIVGKTLQSETVAGITVQFYLADDGHKICPASEEDKVLSLYNKIGFAWYYIIDTAHQRFKLPRRHSQKIVRSVKNADGSWYRLYADGWVEQGGISDASTSGVSVTLPIEMTDANYTVVVGNGETTTNPDYTAYCSAQNRTATSFSFYVKGYGGNGTSYRCCWQVSGQSAIDMSSFQDGEKYLYFYVGAFTQTSLENIASVTTETLNNKVDKGHQLVEFQEPTATNGYTWYRKYTDGWVEQGGYISTAFPETTTVSLVIAMADTHYNINAIAYYGTGNQDGVNVYIYNVTTSSIGISNKMYGGNKTINCYWQVSGMAA